ncbi:hypothetical protein VPHD479_0321 [Vibrio phage D479]
MIQINNYLGAKAALLEQFDISGSFYDIEVSVDKRWRQCDWGSHTIEFGWENDEFQYSLEIYGTSVWKSKCGDYTLAVGDDGCGNRYGVIVSNILEFTEDESVYEVFD